MSDSSGSMWLRMFGLEDLWKTANSPDFQAQISALVAAILETRIRVERIEFKLDALLDHWGIDDAAIPRRHIPGLPVGGSGNGVGIPPAASVAFDAGSGASPGAVERDGGGVEIAGFDAGTPYRQSG